MTRRLTPTARPHYQRNEEGNDEQRTAASNIT